MFSMVILNKWPVLIISQNHPYEAMIPAIVSHINTYGHKQLHITSIIRMKLSHKFKMDYYDIFEAIRKSLTQKIS